jgi:hypothetical protein
MKPIILILTMASCLLPGLAVPAGAASLTGMVTPAGARVSLFHEGKERSAAVASQGRYGFTSLPAGDYQLRATAPGYAGEAVEVRISGDRAVAQNIRLLYVSPVSGIDWERRVIRARGRGLYPDDAANTTVRHKMAKRAAMSDAERNLLRIIEQIKLGPNRELRSLISRPAYTTRIKGYLQGFKIVEEREIYGGVEVELELPLTGSGGLTRYISE